MSHVSTCTTQITDLNILAKACEELGFTVTRNALCKLYYRGQDFESELVISGKGMEYNIGVKKRDDGTYELVTDFWNGSVARACGVNSRKLGQIIDRYDVVAFEQQARKKRIRTERIKKQGKMIVRAYA